MGREVKLQQEPRRMTPPKKLVGRVTFPAESPWAVQDPIPSARNPPPTSLQCSFLQPGADRDEAGRGSSWAAEL